MRTKNWYRPNRLASYQVTCFDHHTPEWFRLWADILPSGYDRYLKYLTCEMNYCIWVFSTAISEIVFSLISEYRILKQLQWSIAMISKKPCVAKPIPKAWAIRRAWGRRFTRFFIVIDFKYSNINEWRNIRITHNCSKKGRDIGLTSWRLGWDNFPPYLLKFKKA